MSGSSNASLVDTFARTVGRRSPRTLGVAVFEARAEDMSGT